jgi:hypothetical protein
MGTKICLMNGSLCGLCGLCVYKRQPPDRSGEGDKKMLAQKGTDVIVLSRD